MDSRTPYPSSAGVPSAKYEEILVLLVWGPAPVRVIARGTSMGPSGVSNRVAWLETEGLIVEVHRCQNGAKVWAITPRGANIFDGLDPYVLPDSPEEVRRAALICDQMITDEQSMSDESIMISKCEIKAELPLPEPGKPGPPGMFDRGTERYRIMVPLTRWGVPAYPTPHTPSWVSHSFTPGESVAHDVFWIEPEPLWLRAQLQAYRSHTSLFGGAVLTCATETIRDACAEVVRADGLEGWATVRVISPSADLKW